MPLEDKTWSKEMEEPIRHKWRASKRYAFNEKTKKKVFSIDTPPPYINAPVHIGHATVYTLMDMFARFKRMTGHEVLFPLGLDRNGLPIEVAAEKKFNVLPAIVGREKFIEYCEKLLEEFSMASVDTFYKLGHSFCSWDLGNNIGDVYYTDSPEYRALTQATFIDIWKRGLVYEDKKVNNYCPQCRTTIADSEIDYRDEEMTFNYVKFKIKETGKDIIIATTRLELICSCAMVIFNPEDARYKSLAGKTAITPIYGKEIPIKAHPYAKIDAGSGLVMMCSFGDSNDIRFFRDEKLEPIYSINVDGTMNENAGFLKGLKVKEARKKIIEEMQAKNLIEKQVKSSHRTPICERSKTPIEFVAMKEIYVRQLEFKEDMRKMAMNLKFYAPQSRQILLDWIDAVSMDWAVSRRRYYATEIPLWYCKKCGETIVPPKGKYYRPWKEPAPVKECPKCKSKEFEGEARVFDTWFDSSISPLYIMHYADKPKFFASHKPVTVRPQGREIVRTWLYYTLLRCHQLLGEPIFRDVWIHYHVVDEKGNKMSKSLGNVINPQEVIEKYGAESFRLWCALEGNIHSTDIMCSFPRIESGNKFLIKLWNASRFISSFPKAELKDSELQPIDYWILGELNELIEFSKNSYEEYDFHNPAMKIKNFVWEVFSSNYLETVKNRAYNETGKYSEKERNAALYTLHQVLIESLKLLAPIVPFITDKIYSELCGCDFQSPKEVGKLENPSHEQKDFHDIHAEKFPEPTKAPKQVSFSTADIIELNSAIWKAKKDANQSLKAEVAELTLPDKFKPIERDIVEMHSVKKVVYGKVIEVKIKPISKLS